MALQLPTPEPLTVDTSRHGRVTLKWLTLRTVATLERYRKEMDDAGFLYSALALHFLEPKISPDELRAWDLEDLGRVTAAWTAYAHGLNRDLGDGEVSAAFAQAFADYSSETQLGFRDAITPLFASIRRQSAQLQSFLGPTTALEEALRSFRESQAVWQSALSQSFTELHGSIFKSHIAFEPALLNTQFLASVTAALSQNSALRGFAVDLPLMAEALQSSSWHQTQLSSLINSELASASASTRLLAGLKSLTLSSQAVWSEWGSGGRLPPEQFATLREAPAIELYTASTAATALMSAEGTDEPPAVVERIATITVRIEPALERVDPGLLATYRGAANVIGRGGPDHPRHFAVSLRELLTHLLHRLAPDEELRRWPGASPEDFPNGRPSRRVRLRYIFRDVQDSTYASFIADDIDRTLELMDVLNADTHRLFNAADTRALRLVLRRVEGVLAILLEAGSLM